jgi:hypothetical protein
MLLCRLGMDNDAVSQCSSVLDENLDVSKRLVIADEGE